MYDLPLPESKMGTDIPAHAPVAPTTVGPQQSLFGSSPIASDDGYKLDEVLFDLDAALGAPGSVATPSKPEAPRSEADLLELLKGKGIRAYPRHTNFRSLPRALKREQRPQMQDMSRVSEAVATRLTIPDELKRNAVRAALNRLKEKEVHTELTLGARH